MRPFLGNQRTSDLAGFAEYSYCASHSRCFLGAAAALAVLCARTADPAAVIGAKADERQLLLGMLDDANLADQIPGTTRIADKNCYGREVDTAVTTAGIDLVRCIRKG